MAPATDSSTKIDAEKFAAIEANGMLLEKSLEWLVESDRTFNPNTCVWLFGRGLKKIHGEFFGFFFHFLPHKWKFRGEKRDGDADVPGRLNICYAAQHPLFPPWCFLFGNTQNILPLSFPTPRFANGICSPRPSRSG